MPHKWTYRLPHDHLKTNVRWSKIQAKATSTLSKNTLFFSFFGTQISISSPKSPYTRHLIWIWHSRCEADHCHEWFAEWAEATRQVAEKEFILCYRLVHNFVGKLWLVERRSTITPPLYQPQLAHVHKVVHKVVALEFFQKKHNHEIEQNI